MLLFLVRLNVYNFKSLEFHFFSLNSDTANNSLSTHYDFL